MHIADGIIAAEMAVAADVVSIGTIYFLGKKIKAADVPKMGMMASALFVASLIHFPIAGTSVHLGFFGLAGIILGWFSYPAVFTALLFQSLIFQHGGLISVGLNSINMGTGAIIASLIWRRSRIPEIIRAFLAGVAGILFPALLMAGEFHFSGYGKSVFYILSIYGILAVIEGSLTLIIVKFFRSIGSSILETNKNVD